MMRRLRQKLLHGDKLILTESLQVRQPAVSVMAQTVPSP